MLSADCGASLLGKGSGCVRLRIAYVLAKVGVPMLPSLKRSRSFEPSARGLWDLADYLAKIFHLLILRSRLLGFSRLSGWRQVSSEFLEVFGLGGRRGDALTRCFCPSKACRRWFCVAGFSSVIWSPAGLVCRSTPSPMMGPSLRWPPMRAPLIADILFVAIPLGHQF